MNGPGGARGLIYGGEVYVDNPASNIVKKECALGSSALVDKRRGRWAVCTEITEPGEASGGPAAAAAALHPPPASTYSRPELSKRHARTAPATLRNTCLDYLSQASVSFSSYCVYTGCTLIHPVKRWANSSRYRNSCFSVQPCKKCVWMSQE